MKELLKALRPVKKRIRVNRLLHGAAVGLAAGLAAAVLLQVFSFFLPVEDRGLAAMILAAAVTALVTAGNVLRPVGDRTAAEAADACGLKERAITALECSGSPICELQRRDALHALESLDLKKIRPGSAKKPLLAALGCAVLLGGLLLIPSPRDSDAAAHKALVKTLQEGRESIERAAEQDERKMSEKERSELRKITEELDRNLNESRDTADALLAMDRAQQRLEQMQQKTAGDAETAATAGEAGGSSADETGQAGQAESTAMNTEGQAQGTMAGQAANARLQTLQALASLKSQMTLSTATVGMSGSGMQGRDGQNGQAGAGTGSGEKTGNGAGTGTTNEEQQGSGQHNSGTVLGNRDPEYKEAQYETIYDPERIGVNTGDVMTNQERLSDEGSLQLQTGPGRGNLQGDVPWSDAVGEYEQTEAQAADRENLTPTERQWVTDYFTKLTEQK